MDNPYNAPNSKVLTENEKVIDLLVRFKQQMKVVNMLRQEGMGYEEARSVVAENVKSAQKVLAKKNRFWKITAWLLIFSGTVLPVITYLGGHLTFVSAAPLFGGLYCFRLCDKIKF